jgi:hypothetical protein
MLPGKPWVKRRPESHSIYNFDKALYSASLRSPEKSDFPAASSTSNGIEIGVTGDPVHGIGSSRSTVRNESDGGSEDAAGEDNTGDGGADGARTTVGDDWRSPRPMLMEKLIDM